jgi:hypothetical protein
MFYVQGPMSQGFGHVSSTHNFTAGFCWTNYDLHQWRDRTLLSRGALSYLTIGSCCWPSTGSSATFNPRGISHLQYADDTLIMIQYNKSHIAHLKFLPMWDNMSGLKLNYNKCEVIVMGQPVETQCRVADMLNYKLGSSHLFTLAC